MGRSAMPLFTMATRKVFIYVLQNEELKAIQAESRHQTLKPVGRSVSNMMLQTPDWSPTILEEAGITSPS